MCACGCVCVCVLKRGQNKSVYFELFAKCNTFYNIHSKNQEANLDRQYTKKLLLKVHTHTHTQSEVTK